MPSLASRQDEGSTRSEELAGSCPGPSAFDPDDPRSGPRCTCLEHRAWVAWWRGAEFRTADARLLDVGTGGASLEADVRPDDGRLLLALQGGPPDSSVWARVVRVGRGRLRSYRLHLVFVEPCPEGLLRGAIEGLRR